MTRDQFLAEMMGIKWQEHDCSSCTSHNPDFSDDSDYILALQQWVMAQEWWDDFYQESSSKFHWRPSEVICSGCCKWIFSDPDRFANLVAEYRGWKDA